MALKRTQSSVNSIWEGKVPGMSKVARKKAQPPKHQRTYIARRDHTKDNGKFAKVLAGREKIFQFLAKPLAEAFRSVRAEAAVRTEAAKRRDNFLKFIGVRK